MIGSNSNLPPGVTHAQIEAQIETTEDKIDSLVKYFRHKGNEEYSYARCLGPKRHYRIAQAKARGDIWHQAANMLEHKLKDMYHEDQ
jgi:hypothetical protein